MNLRKKPIIGVNRMLRDGRQSRDCEDQSNMHTNYWTNNIAFTFPLKLCSKKL